MRCAKCELGLCCREQSLPVIKYLQECGRMTEITADGSPDEVFESVKVVIERVEAGKSQ